MDAADAEAEERAKENERIHHAFRGGLALAPASAILGLALVVSIDLGGTVPVATLTLAVGLLVVLAGPAILPFVSASSRGSMELSTSIELAIEEWSRRGPVSWLTHGFALGVVLAAPSLLLAVPGVCLGLPIGLGISGALGRILVVQWSAREPASLRSQPSALALVVLVTILGPLLLATLVPAPMWLVDRRPFAGDAAPRDMPSTPEVYLEDAPFFVIGVNVVRGSERELVRAPLGIFERLVREPGRVRLLWSDEAGGYYVPFTEEGARADDGPLDRLRARLDLGGALPVAAFLVAVALAVLAWAVAQRGRRGTRAAALLAALLAHAAVAWAY